jgi:preprotein translocase subunit SecF
MSELETIRQEINKIKERNAKVEADKAWETSVARKITIAILTYFVIILFFYFASLPKPFINAIVPTVGFLLSTLSISVMKNIWIKHRQKK